METQHWSTSRGSEVGLPKMYCPFTAAELALMGRAKTTFARKLESYEPETAL